MCAVGQEDDFPGLGAVAADEGVAPPAAHAGVVFFGVLSFIVAGAAVFGLPPRDVVPLRGQDAGRENWALHVAIPPPSARALGADAVRALAALAPVREAFAPRGGVDPPAQLARQPAHAHPPLRCLIRSQTM